MDDHHIHEVYIQSPIENITITTYSLQIQDDFQVEWIGTKNMEWMTTKNYLIRFDNNIIQIEDFIKKGMNKQRLKLLLNRSRVPYGGRILRINFPKLIDYENIDGLVGRIGNNKFKFYDQILGTKILESGTVSVNGIYSTAHRGMKEEKNCWFMSVKHALNPHKFTLYIA